MLTQVHQTSSWLCWPQLQ